MALIDVVNFNGDASCLSSSKWLKCLKGGSNSLLMRVLRNYVGSQRKVNLGLAGTTIKDIAFFNPGAIDFINEHPETFEVLMRPFAHDNALLRLPNGFRFNLDRGLRCIRQYFSNVTTSYLSPEVMITSEQIHMLANSGVTSIFVHKGRYDFSLSERIPDGPFVLQGVLGTEMLCLPFSAKDIEYKYLQVIHGVLHAEEWCRAVLNHDLSDLIIWRDGESCLLLPGGVDREEECLSVERKLFVERSFVSEGSFAPRPLSVDDDSTLKFFPLHSLRPWLNEMKLYWYVSRVRDIEERLDTLPEPAKLFWLLTINSDILSSAEKNPPVIDVAPELFQLDRNHFLWSGVIPLPEECKMILNRSERAGEGEDYLAYLDLLLDGKTTAAQILNDWKQSHHPHLLKGYARISGELTEP